MGIGDRILRINLRFLRHSRELKARESKSASCPSKCLHKAVYLRQQDLRIGLGFKPQREGTETCSNSKF